LLFLRVLQHDLLDARNSFAWVEPLRTSLGAVEYCVATVKRILALHHVHALQQRLVARIDHPTIRLHQDGWTQVLVTVPPIAWATGRAACTEDAFIEAVQFSAILNRLMMSSFSKLLLSLALEIGLDAGVLIIEIRHVRDEILDYVHVRQGINLNGLFAALDLAQASQRVTAVYIHGA